MQAQRQACAGARDTEMSQTARLPPPLEELPAEEGVGETDRFCAVSA